MNTLLILKEVYTSHRNITMGDEQFIYLVNTFPALLVVKSDGLVDRDEWNIMKSLARILGHEFATEDLGIEKEENLTLIYRAEFRYLLKNKDIWQLKFLDALKEYFKENTGSKEFIMETMYLFAHASDGVSKEEAEIIQMVCDHLGIDDFEFDESKLL